MSHVGMYSPNNIVVILWNYNDSQYYVVKIDIILNIVYIVSTWVQYKTDTK